MPRGNKAGAKFWHKEEDGVIKVLVTQPGAPEPDVSWSKGRGPLSEKHRQALSDRMKENKFYPENFNAKKGCRWFFKLVDGVYHNRRINPGEDLPDATWTEGRKPLTERQKRRLSEANTGRVMDEVWRSRMSAASKGKPKSEEHKKAMSIASRAAHARRKAAKDGES
jgi:hypothetical protein